MYIGLPCVNISTGTVRAPCCDLRGWALCGIGRPAWSAAWAERRLKARTHSIPAFAYPQPAFPCPLTGQPAQIARVTSREHRGGNTALSHCVRGCVHTAIAHSMSIPGLAVWLTTSGMLGRMQLPRDRRGNNISMSAHPSTKQLAAAADSNRLSYERKRPLRYRITRGMMECNDESGEGAIWSSK